MTESNHTASGTKCPICRLSLTDGILTEGDEFEISRELGEAIRSYDKTLTCRRCRLPCYIVDASSTPVDRIGLCKKCGGTHQNKRPNAVMCEVEIDYIVRKYRSDELRACPKHGIM